MVEGMKKINLIIRKCKSLSRQLGRSSSYSSLRSKSTREELHVVDTTEEEQREIVFVGRSRKRYMISTKHLNHPLINALIEKSKEKPGGGGISVKCEVVLFDHLLWMLENADPNITSDSLEELAELYTY
ncbi:auxin-responsive protein SAUR77 [Telopea speciosissima]|uniref:auxin-responsive protein SAUR77 n=1 Tax=Telopea speciosissima TaxID=54955 RepID=UPI001CC47229|nr:auxin-responsive protein SAUR77 [Telopea speciosissima]